MKTITKDKYRDQVVKDLDNYTFQIWLTSLRLVLTVERDVRE